MSKQHTPGPWIAKKIQRGQIFYWQVSERVYNGFEICSTANAEVNQDEANARLIAASPELLELCKELLVTRIKYGTEQTELTERLRAVIAKAEWEK